MTFVWRKVFDKQKIPSLRPRRLSGENLILGKCDARDQKDHEMIDLHSHILSGLDDGADTLEESIEMCRISYRDGVRIMVATPHTLNGVYTNDRETILTKVRELNAALLELRISTPNSQLRTPNSVPQVPHSELCTSQSAICNPHSAFQVFPGADVRFSEEIVHQLDRGNVTTIGDGKRFLSVEFPHQGIPYRAEDVLFQLMARGVIPVISHPERNLEIRERPKRYYEMVNKGCLGQVTAMSLTGEFGNGIKRTVEKFIKKRLVHIIASDAHSTNGRSPILSEAVRVAERIVGEEEAWKMVTDYPKAILEGKRPPVPEPSCP